MTGGVYRNADDAARERMRELEGAIETRGAAVPERIRPFLPEAERHELEVAHAELVALGDPSKGPVARMPFLERYAAALEAALTHAPSAQARYDELPTESPDPPEFPFSIYADSRGAKHALERIVRELDPSARFEHEPTEIRVRFALAGAPYALRYRWRTLEEPNFKERMVDLAPSVDAVVHPISGDFVLASSAVRDAKPLTLTPEGALHSIGKSLGLVREIEVGDMDLDAAFLIRGDEDTARSLLQGTMRHQLLAFCRFDVPTLEIRPGRVSLAWHYETTPKFLRHAARILELARGRTGKT